jgi:O-antigen/teichoic acid export membrane protein
MTTSLDPGGDQASPTHVLDLPTAGGKIIRGSLLRAAAYGASVLLGILSAALMTRHLGVVSFGQYVTVLSIVTVAMGMADVGMSNIGVREYSVREGPERDRLMENLLGLRIALAAAAAAVAVAFTAAAGYPGVMVAGTAVAALAYLLTTVQQTIAVPLSAGLRLGWTAALDILRQAALVAVVIALVFAGAGLLPFLWAPIPVAIALLVLTAWLVHGTIPFLPRFHTRAWGRLIRLVLPYAAASAVGAIYVSLVMIITSLVASEQETGYFGASFRIYAVLAVIPALIVTSAFPVLARAARDDRVRLRYGLQRLWDIAVLLGAGAAVLTFVGAPFAIRVVAGPEFEASVSVLRIQSVTLFAAFLVSVWSFGLLSLASYRGLLIANLLALVLAAASALALAPEFGADGAAVATLIGDGGLAVALGIQLMLPHRDLRVDPWIVTRVLVATALAAAVLLVPGVPNLVELLLAAVVYLAVTVLLRAVPREVWAALRRRELEE